MQDIFNEIVRFTYDEIQTSLDEIKAYGLDEIKSVFYPPKAISSATVDLFRL